MRNSTVPPEIRDAFVSAYTGQAALGAGFELYRAAGRNTEIVARAARDGLHMPTMGIGAASVGGTLASQLEPVARDLTAVVMADCGHIVPLDRPAELAATLRPFLRR